MDLRSSDRQSTFFFEFWRIAFVLPKITGTLMNEIGFDGRTVLIADDEEYVRRHLSKRLTRMGLRVLQAGTGDEVLAQINKNPDLIIMDIRMPVLDGLETLEQIRNSESTRRIPVVLLSALAQSGEISPGLSVGADEYLMKPITFERLLESIRLHL